MKSLRMVFYIIFILLIAGGCASSRSSEVYSRDQAQKSQTVKMGTVEIVKPVRIEGTKSPVGVIAGGAAGAVLGSTIGSGSGRTVATVLGGLAGAGGGAVAEEKLTQKDGLEITVKLDNGEALVVVQEADVPFQVGDRVRVLTGSDGTTRVTK